MTRYGERVTVASTWDRGVDVDGGGEVEQTATTTKTPQPTPATAGADGWQETLVRGLERAVEWMFLAILVVLPLDAYLVLPPSHSGVFLSEVLTAEAAVLLGATLLAAKALRVPSTLRLRWHDAVPLGLVVLTGMLSLVHATSRDTAAKECLKYAVYLGIYLLARACWLRSGMRMRALVALWLSFAVVVVFGMLSPATHFPDLIGPLLNIQRTPAAISFSTIIRAESTFRYPNELAIYLLLTLPIVAASAVRIPWRAERIALATLAALGVGVLFLTYTRGALIALVLALPLALFLIGGRRLGLVGALLVIAGGGLIVLHGGASASRLLSIFTPATASYSERFAAWRWALNSFTHSPVFGVGAGNISLQPNAPWINQAAGLREANAENLYLNVFAELGVIGLGVVLYCLGGAIRRAWESYRQGGDWADQAWNIGLLSALVALLIYGVVDPVLLSAQDVGTLCALVGLSGSRRLSAKYAVAPGDVADLAVPVAPVAPPLSPQPVTAQVAADRTVDLSGTSTPRGRQLSARVIFLINAPGFGGAQQHSINLATDLHRRGERVLVVCPPQSPLLPLLAQRGVPYLVRDLGMPIGRMRGVLGTLNYVFNPFDKHRLEQCVRGLALEEPGIFVCPFPREQLLVTPLCRRLGMPIVWGIHAPMSYLPHRLFLRLLWHRWARAATAIFTVSEEFTWRLASTGFPADRLMILHNAVLHEALAAADEVAPVPGRLAIVSRLTKRKGVQYALRAVPAILARHPEAQLQIAGTGRYLGTLRGVARKLHIEDRVQFLGYQSNPATVVSTASVLLCPSVDDAEVLPTTILEAFAAGRPVVASEIASIPEVVHGGATGLLVPPGDSQALADAVCSLLDDPARAQMLGSQGQELVRRSYTFEQVGANFTRLLQVIEAGEDISSAGLQPLSVSAEIRAVHRPRLIGNTGLFVFSKVLTALATALWTVLAARALTPAAYGDLMLAAAIVELGAIITNAGVTTVATRELAAARNEGELRRLTSTLIYLKLALGIVAMVDTVAVGLALPFDDRTHVLLIVLGPGLIYVSLNSLTLVFRAQMHFPVTVRIALIVATANIAAALLVFAIVPTALGFALADLAATLLAGVLTLVLVLRHARPEPARIGSRAFRAQLAGARSLLVSSLVLGLSMALNIFYVRIDVPLLALLTNSTQVAIYTSAYRVIDMVSLLPVSAAGVALPLLVTLGQQRREYLRAFAQQYLDIAVVCGLFIAFLLTLVGHEVITLLYGGRYAAAEPVLLVLGWASAAMFVTNVFNPISVALNHRWTLALAAALGLVANVGLNLLLIPRFGPVGPAWSTLLTELAVTVPLAITVMQDLRWRPDLYTIVAAIEATGVALLSTFLTRSTAGWESDAIAVLIWVVALTILAPGWSFALVRSLVRVGKRSTPAHRVTAVKLMQRMGDTES